MENTFESEKNLLNSTSLLGWERQSGQTKGTGKRTKVSLRKGTVKPSTYNTFIAYFSSLTLCVRGCPPPNPPVTEGSSTSSDTFVRLESSLLHSWKIGQLLLLTGLIFSPTLGKVLSRFHILTHSQVRDSYILYMIRWHRQGMRALIRSVPFRSSSLHYFHPKKNLVSVLIYEIPVRETNEMSPMWFWGILYHLVSPTSTFRTSVGMFSTKRQGTSEHQIPHLLQQAKPKYIRSFLLRSRKCVRQGGWRQKDINRSLIIQIHCGIPLKIS